MMAVVVIWVSLLVIALALISGQPLSMMITVILGAVISVIAAFVVAFIRGWKQDMPPMRPGETARQYEDRMYHHFDKKNPLWSAREHGFQSMKWQDFEKVVEHYFNRLGYATMHTGRTGDQGVDIQAYHPVDGSRVIIQCKHYAQNVGSVDVQKLAGAMVAHGADKAFLVTNADFTEQARSFASLVPGLTLISGKVLAETWEGVS